MNEALLKMVGISKEILMNARSFVKEKWSSGPRARIPLMGLPVLFSVAILFLVWEGLFGSYSLNASISRSIQMAPADANWVFVSRDPGRLFRDIRDSRLARGVIDTEAWSNFTSLERFADIRSVLYLLGLKAGLPAEFTDFLSFPGKDMIVAGMEDGSFLVIFRADIKSKLGVALLSAFRGESIPLQKESSPGTTPASKTSSNGGGEARENQTPGDATPVSEESYANPLAEERSKTNGVTVSRFRFENRFLYMVLMGDYLFVSDSLPTLHKSLELATDPGKGSLSAVPGMDKVLEAERSGGRLVACVRLDRDPYLPYLKTLTPATGRVAFVFFPPENEILSARIFAVGESDSGEQDRANNGEDKTGKAKKEPDPASAWAGRIPADLPAFFYSRDFSAADSEKRIEELASSDANRGFAEAIPGFFSAAGISLDAYFKDRRGLALLFHGFRRDGDLLLPEITVGYESALRDDRILTAIFQGSSRVERKKTGILYTMEEPDSFHYTPALWISEQASFLSTREEDLKTVLSAKEGNRPVASDLKTYSLLGAYKESPVQLVVRLPLVADAIKEFYYYGADLSSDYSRVTVDRDIVPLLSPLRDAGILHIALKEKGTGEVGRLVITGVR